MHYDLSQAMAILERTPSSLQALLNGLPDEWTKTNEGGDSWTPFEVAAHLLYCDRAAWLLRIRQAMSSPAPFHFEPLNRLGGRDLMAGQSLSQILAAFVQTRREVLEEVRQLAITPAQYGTPAIHPDFGTVTLSQLLSTWVVHDLSHLAQVCRVMASQYREEVGPWKAYLRILRESD